MKYCSNCLKQSCRCGSPKIDVDYYIYPAIYELNRKGYKINSCCSGYEDDSNLTTCIVFKKELEENIDSEYFQYEAYKYRGIHESRDCIRVKAEIQKQFKKKRTDKLKLIQTVNKDLYRWAKTLPIKSEFPCQEIEFPDSYFDKEVERDEIVDVQKPWMLFTKLATNNGQTLRDFLEEIDGAKFVTEVIVNKSGRIMKFSDRDYTSERGLLKKIDFDISGDFQYFLCGYEPYAVIEKIIVNNAVWYMAYARTDVAIEYGDADKIIHKDSYRYGYNWDCDWDEDEECCEGRNECRTAEEALDQPLFDEYDIEDFIDEHPNANELELFTCLFEKLSEKNINICVFSADNINIVFSNQIDFHVLLENEQSVIAFGEADYEYIEFSKVHVERKNIYVYANGKLLIKKEVEVYDDNK